MIGQNRPNWFGRRGRIGQKGIVAVRGCLIGSQQARGMSLPSKAALQWWRRCYFATERGREGYEEYRREFAGLILRVARPTYDLEDASIGRGAAAYGNPDHLNIAKHNCRWRLGISQGDPGLDQLEAARKSERPSTGRANRSARRRRHPSDMADVCASQGACHESSRNDLRHPGDSC
jgi:hypothetical protein